MNKIQFNAGAWHQSAVGDPFRILPCASATMRQSHWWMRDARPVIASPDNQPTEQSSGFTLDQVARRIGLPSGTPYGRVQTFVSRRTNPHVRALSASTTDEEKQRGEELFARAGIGLDSVATCLWLDPALLKEKPLWNALRALVNVLPLPVLRKLVPYEASLKALSATGYKAETADGDSWVERSNIALPRIAAVLGMTRLDPLSDVDLEILGALEGFRDVCPLQSIELLLSKGPNIARFR